MILLDNIYYIFCLLYRKSKEERRDDSWRGTGGVITSGYLSIFLMLFCIKWISQSEYPKLVISAIFLITGALILLRYTKYMSFDKFEKKRKDMSQRSMEDLDIITYIFLFTCLPLSAVCAYYSK